MARHATSILDTESERVRCFMKGLSFPIQMSTQSLVVIGRSFAKILDHTWVLDEVHHEAQEATIRGLVIRIILVEAVAVPNSEVVVLIVGILCIHPIILRFS